MTVREDKDEGRAGPETLTYKVPEAARAIGAGENSTRRLIRIGALAHIRIGRNILVPKRAVEEYIEREAFGKSRHDEHRRSR